jgi:hypothetical protein
MSNEPKISTVTKTLGTLNVKFEGEQYSGHPVLDTKVSINGEVICWITWNDRDSFMNELQSVISKYYI